MATIGVIGAGAWGTALAQNFASHDHDVKLWARDLALADDINLTRQNRIYLRDIPLHQKIKAQNDLADTCAADIILLTVPAQHLRGVMTKAVPHIHHNIPVIVCSKGIELETGKLMSDVVGDLLPASMVGVLSGPNFAHEVAKGLPAAATLASIYNTKILPVRDTLSNQRFRIYTTNDVVGTEVGGAVKNVIAIVCGIIAGRNLGENARAAAVTRGLHEIARLAEAMGGRRETLMGLSGIGDLILTCSSMQSRNFSLGYALGQGKSLPSILEERRGVTEGIPTAAAVMQLAARFKAEMPLVGAVHACLNGTLGVEDALQQLMERPAKDELGR